MAIRAPNLFGNIDWSGYHRANEYTVEAGRAKGEAAANIGKSLSFGLQLVGQRREKAKDQARASAEKADDRAYAEQQRDAEYKRKLQYEKDKTTFEVGQQLQQEMEATKQAIAMLPPDAPQPDEQQAQNIQAALRLGERIGPAVDLVGSRVERNADAGGLEQSDLANSLREAMARHGQYSTAKQVAAKKGVAPAVLYRLAGEEAKAAADVEILKGSLQRKEGDAKVAEQEKFDTNAAFREIDSPVVMEMIPENYRESLRRAVAGREIKGSDAIEILRKQVDNIQQERTRKATIDNRGEIDRDRDAARKVGEDRLTLSRDRFELEKERGRDALASKDADRITKANKSLEGAFRNILDNASAYADPSAAIKMVLQGVSPEQATYLLESVKPTDPGVVAALMERRSVGTQPAPSTDTPAPAGDPYEALAEWLRANPGATPDEKRAKARELKGVR